VRCQKGSGYLIWQIYIMALKISTISIIFLVVLIIYIIYSSRMGPLTPRFCDLYSEESKNYYADLVRRLNNFELCGESQYDVFDEYITWKDEMIAGVKGNVLVFKGSDTLQDWAYNLTPHRGTRLYNDIGLIYDEIKDVIREVIQRNKITVLTGWSLGAILSCITAMDLESEIHEVILFGLPNIFTDSFITEYNDRLGRRTIVHNNRLDIFANAMGYGKDRTEVGNTNWVNTPLSDSYKLITRGLGYYHMSYFE